jgi:hypothetical protein
MRPLKIIEQLMFLFIVAFIVASVTSLPLIGVGAALIGFAALPKPDGVAMFNFADLTWADGEENMGGVKVTAYYALAADIETFPVLPTSPATAADEVTLDGNFVMKAGKYFHKIYCTMQTGEVVDENQGEADGQSFVHKATLFYPGTKVEALAFAKNANNSNMIFVIEEVTGQMRVVGSEAIPAKVKPSFTTGKAYADRKGMTLEVTSYGYTPAPVYTGYIDLAGENYS